MSQYAIRLEDFNGPCFCNPDDILTVETVTTPGTYARRSLREWLMSYPRYPRPQTTHLWITLRHDCELRIPNTPENDRILRCWAVTERGGPVETVTCGTADADVIKRVVPC